MLNNFITHNVKNAKKQVCDLSHSGAVDLHACKYVEWLEMVTE